MSHMNPFLITYVLVFLNNFYLLDMTCLLKFTRYSAPLNSSSYFLLSISFIVIYVISVKFLKHVSIFYYICISAKLLKLIKVPFTIQYFYFHIFYKPTKISHQNKLHHFPHYSHSILEAVLQRTLYFHFHHL